MTVMRTAGQIFGYALTGALIAVIDFHTNRMAIWVLYLAPIGLATWNLGLRPGLLLGSLALSLQIGKILLADHPFDGFQHFVFGMLLRTWAIGLVVWLVAALRKREVERVYLKEVR